jgi:hypothetical protein
MKALPTKRFVARFCERRILSAAIDRRYRAPDVFAWASDLFDGTLAMEDVDSNEKIG